MDDAERRSRIAEQLSHASAAHFEYETNTLDGVYDQQWAEWYADYMLAHGWNELFTHAWSIGDLAAKLRQLDQDYRAQAPQSTWQEFYAARLAEG